MGHLRRGAERHAIPKISFVSRQGRNESGYDSDGSDASFASAISGDQRCARPSLQEDNGMAQEYHKILKVRKWLQKLVQRRNLTNNCSVCQRRNTPRNTPRQVAGTATSLPVVTPVVTVDGQESGRYFTTDVGWATITVDHGETRRSTRHIRIIAKEIPITDEMMSITCDFIRRLLTPTGWPYHLVYDCRNLRAPKLSVMLGFAKFGNEPEIMRISQQRCLTCNLILAPGARFTMIHASVAALFKFMPPACRTYLLTEDGPPPPGAIYFDPPGGPLGNYGSIKNDIKPFAYANGDIASSTLRNDGPENTESVRPVRSRGLGEAIQNLCCSRAPTAGCFAFMKAHSQRSAGGAAASSKAQPQALRSRQRDDYNTSEHNEKSSKIDVEWAEILVDHGTTPGSTRHIRIVARDIAITDETMSITCDFIRKLLTPSDWPYSLVYDCRKLRAPKVSVVIGFAKFGNEPAIFRISQQRCVACKLILAPGMRFKMIHASVTALFKFMPPACRTYLLTDENGSEADAVYFDPPHVRGSQAHSSGVSTEAVVQPPSTDPSSNDEKARDPCSTEDTPATAQLLEAAQDEQSNVTDVEWAKITVDHDQTPNAKRYIRIIASGVPISDESMSATCDWIRKLLIPSDWPYDVTYDCRLLRAPKLSVVIGFAKLGSDPVIFKISQERCSSCKLILAPGYRFRVIQASVAGLFKLMPPACRTYLVTEDFPDGNPPPDAAYFDPPAHLAISAQPAAPAVADVSTETAVQYESLASSCVGGINSDEDALAATSLLLDDELDEVVSPSSGRKQLSGPTFGM